MGWWSIARWAWWLVVLRFRSRLIKVILRGRSLLVRLGLEILLRLEALLRLEVLVLAVVIVELASLELLFVESSCTGAPRNQIVGDHNVTGQSGDLVVQESYVLASSSLVVVVLVAVLKGVQHSMGHSRLF